MSWWRTLLNTSDTMKGGKCLGGQLSVVIDFAVCGGVSRGRTLFDFLGSGAATAMSVHIAVCMTTLSVCQGV
jgi:hypothetical protein